MHYLFVLFTTRQCIISLVHIARWQTVKYSNQWGTI